MKHKHAEVAHAFLDGIECEWFDNLNNKWHLIRELKDFDWVDNVRIKPELQEQEPQYLYVYNQVELSKTMVSPTFIQETYGWAYMGKVRVEK